VLASFGRQITSIKEFERKNGLQHRIEKRKKYSDKFSFIYLFEKFYVEYSKCLQHVVV
jgi:hypothetical protein